MGKIGSKSANYFDTDVTVSILSIKQIIETGILTPHNSSHPFFRPCVGQILIELRDLLHKADRLGKRVTFCDDVLPKDGKQRDVTDLITDCRNAVCHISSGIHIFEQNKFTFNVVAGYFPNAISINGHTMGCDYADDIAVLWGSLRLYVHRHLLRAFVEIEKKFPNPWS
ncbi:hypothetical protein [Sphingopyxis sp.]|uniref:hypothetical protein n=1 Tax=Sphingopyxis sp. TaxID=1908224 RepID=UPI0035B35F01